MTQKSHETSNLKWTFKSYNVPILSTFWKGSELQNGELNGDGFREFVSGLLVSDEALSLLGSTLHFLLLPWEIKAFRPTNQTSASSLSLHICSEVSMISSST